MSTLATKKKPRSIEETTKLFWVPGFRPSKCQNFPESNGSWLSELNSYWRGTKKSEIRHWVQAFGWKLEHRNPMDALIQFGGAQIEIFFIKKDRIWGVAFTRWLVVWEALVAVALFWVCKFLFKGGSLQWESWSRFCARNEARLKMIRWSFPGGGQQMSGGHGWLIRLRNSQMRSGFFFSVVFPTPPEIWRIDTYPESWGFVRCISFQFLIIFGYQFVRFQWM